jgi:hypothetical protein
MADVGVVNGCRVDCAPWWRFCHAARNAASAAVMSRDDSYIRRPTMRLNTLFLAGALMALTSAPAAADDILDAIEQGRKAYRAGDLAGAKQSLDLASQLIGQKNAESFAKLLPQPLAGWTADEPQITAVGAVALGASTASRRYHNAKGEQVDLQITGDSALITQFATMLANPQIAGAMGKIIRVGSQRAVQTARGDVHLVVNNRFLVMATGSAPGKDKLAYVSAVDFATLSKM